MQKILVLRGGALGDFIVTLPALALLNHAWPHARLELAGNAAAAALALERGLLGAVHSQHEARWSALFGSAPLPDNFARWLGEFDLVVNFWPDVDGALRAHFPRHAAQTFLHGEAQPALAPAAAHFCEPLRALGLAPREFFYALDAASPTATRIALHPGSGSPRKNWPLERWRTLAEWLARDQRRELLVVTGEAETEAARALARFGTAAHNLPLPQLVRELARCRLFLGHDSGVSHLAAACGVPCVLLFGPTDPVIWAPPAAPVRVLRRGAELNAISLADVQSATLAALADRK